MYLAERDFDLYLSWRKYYLWAEMAFILSGVYYIPAHTATEGCVAFFASLATKALHDIIVSKLKLVTGL